MLKTLYLNVDDEKFEVVEIEKELSEYYRLIKCTCIDIVTRKIGNRWYDIICDDEGLLNNNPKISAIGNLGNVMLVGNLLITNSDEEGDTTSLTDEDIKYLERFILNMSTRNHIDGYPMLTQVEY